MMTSTYQRVHITDKQFEILAGYIQSNYGIRLPLQKKMLLESRLQGRLAHFNFSSFEDYIHLLFDQPDSLEIYELVDAVSTNKTFFFRETKHFDYLEKQILPTFSKSKLKIWSAAASTGEEAFTAAMVLEEFRLTNKVSWTYEILGTDISKQCLRVASKGIYSSSQLSELPEDYVKKYLLRNKGSELKKVRLNEKIRAQIGFKYLNLISNEYGIASDFDVVFCRNVLIYFEKPIQEIVLNKICKKIKVGGYLFLGHSESILGMTLPLKQLAPTIFKRI